MEAGRNFARMRPFADDLAILLQAVGNPLLLFQKYGCVVTSPAG